jgi:hypothetical protein
MKQQLLKGVGGLVIWIVPYWILLSFQPFIFQTQWAPITAVDPYEWIESTYRKNMLILAGVSGLSTVLWLGWAWWKDRNTIPTKQLKVEILFWAILLGLQIGIAFHFFYQYYKTIPEFKPVIWSALFSLLNIFVFYWVTTAIFTPGQLKDSVPLSQIKILSSIRKNIDSLEE